MYYTNSNELATAYYRLCFIQKNRRFHHNDVLTLSLCCIKILKSFLPKYQLFLYFCRLNSEKKKFISC